MRFLSLDYEPVYGDTALSAFTSDESVFDHDAVLWDPAASFRTYLREYQSMYRGLPSLSEDVSVRMAADVSRRRNEFEQFLAIGRTLVVIVRRPQKCYIDTGERKYSGTGRNRHTTNIVREFDLMKALPAVGQCVFSGSSGTMIAYNGDGPVVSILRKYSQFIRYEAFMTDCPGTPIAHIPETDRLLSAVLGGPKGGLLILLPGFDFLDDDDENPESEDADAGNDEDDENDGWVRAAYEFQEDLVSTIEGMSTTAGSRPAWTKRFGTTRQLTILQKIADQQKRVESARSELARLQQERERIEARDQLFLGTGRPLELEVKAVLELLGGVVTEAEPGRDDWRVSFPEGAAVVEVKGVTKSAAEKHAAQLEKWVAEALVLTGVQPKGILAVNTYRDTPIDQRKDPDFPDQMIPYCSSRSHCLITGLQLYAIREEVEADPTKAEQFRKAILGTSGRFVGSGNWSAYIREISEKE